jgi:eukaryotic-like serine/threonine-protein kinase
MEPNSPQQLFQALRESGLLSPEQVTVLDGLSAEALKDVPNLARKLRDDKILSGYQYQKFRRSRFSDLIIGQYLILDKIGEGGMGKVYKAAQCRTGRIVALKVVRQQLLTQRSVLRRYEREVAASAKLHHPNIVALLDADEDRGRHYLAMEYVFGSDLARLVKECGPLPYPEAAEYICQAAMGLQHAHEQNFVHRDIKPSNLLVSGERALPETAGIAAVRILDMGLIRSMLEEDSDGQSELTRDGTVVGTPDYMSPEQAKNSSTVDGRADLYSLGCTLFFLLTGKPPFPDGSPIDKLLRHQLDPPPDLRLQRPDLPPEMLAVLSKMLAKDPKDRQQRASDVVKALYPFTPEGIANTPEIVLTMPEKAAPANPTPAPVVYDAEILDAEVVMGPPTPKPKAPVVAARKKASVKLLPRESDSDEIVSKSGTSTTSPRRRPDDSDSLETDPRTRTNDTTVASKRRPAKVRNVPKKSASQMPIFASIAALLLLLAAGSIFWALSRPTNTNTENKNSNTVVNANTTPVVPVRAPFLPAWRYIPEGTTAVVVVYPGPYWTISREQIGLQSAFAKLLNRLASRYQFDLRSSERAICSLQSSKDSSYLCCTEGAFLTADWPKPTDLWPGTKVESADATTYLKFPSASSASLVGAVIPGAYLVSSATPLLREITTRAAGTKPKIEPALLAALPKENDENKPFATFVATGDWRLPNGTRLIDLGAELVVVRARLVGQQFDVEVEISGNRERVSEFVNISLWRIINKDYPLVKPFLQAVAENNANDGWDRLGSWDRLKKSQHEAWHFENVTEWLEKILEDASFGSPRE